MTGLPVSEFSFKLRSVSLNKQANCLSSRKCVTDTVETRGLQDTCLWLQSPQLEEAEHTGASIPACTCFVKEKTLCSLCLGRHWSDCPGTGYRFALLRSTRHGVKCCMLHQKNCNSFFFVDGLAGRKTEAKNS